MSSYYNFSQLLAFLGSSIYQILWGQLESSTRWSSWRVLLWAVLQSLGFSWQEKVGVLFSLEPRSPFKKGKEVWQVYMQGVVTCMPCVGSVSDRDQNWNKQPFGADQGSRWSPKKNQWIKNVGLQFDLWTTENQAIKNFRRDDNCR